MEKKKTVAELAQELDTLKLDLQELKQRLLYLENIGQKHEPVKTHEKITLPKWEFTEEEKVILRNLPSMWHWITRDEGGTLEVRDIENIPHKNGCVWDGALRGGHCRSLDLFGHLFQTIKWEDAEPCPFREYI